MKTLEQQMSVYLRYHRDGRNKATHFIGVPLIVFAILIPMSWPAVTVAGLTITLAAAFVAVVLVYYFVLDAALALALVPVVGFLLWAADRIAQAGMAFGWEVFTAAFVGGWILQLVGHVFEGRRPALVDNLFQIVIAPIFLMAELFFALGLKRDVRRATESLAAEA